MEQDPKLGTPVKRELFRLTEIDEDHVKAVAFNMVFMIWRRRTMADAYRRGIQMLQELSAQFPEGVAVCQVVEVDAVPPDSAARAALVELLKMQVVKHFSLTHDGVGFKAASVRAVVASVHALGRPVFKHAVHSSVGAAARWHERAQAELGRNEPAALIESIVTKLRELHRQRYPNV